MVEKIKRIVKKIPPLTLLIPLACLIFVVIYQINVSKNTSAKRVSIEIVDVTTEQSGRNSAAVIHLTMHNSSNRDCTFIKGTLSIRDKNGNLLTENDWDFGSWGNFTLSHNESKNGTLTIFCDNNNRLLYTPFSEMEIGIAVSDVTYTDPPLSIFRVLYYIILYPLCAVGVFLLGLFITLGFAAIGIPIGSLAKSGQETVPGASLSNSRQKNLEEKRHDNVASDFRVAVKSPNNQDNARKYQQEITRMEPSDTYFGVIYFRDGRRVETGNCSGGGAEQMAEQMTSRQFDQYMRTATSDFFKPTRYEVKKK